MPRLFITDCEGPISKNDNAYELTQHLVPDGDKFFALISKYDDVQADVLKRLGYKAGDTLKLIVPFLRAYGATNEKMRRFSAEHILLVQGAKDTLKFVQHLMPSFIVSASYEQYMLALCDTAKFPFNNVYCTRLDVDRYKLSIMEVERLKKLKGEIVSMPVIEIPEHAHSINGFSIRDQETIKRLDEIFWKEISKMESGEILKEVNPVGGFEKAKAVQEIIKKTGGELRDTIYVGDSITDVQPFQLVREEGGLTVSFNGNSYAIREAEIAVLSNNTIVTSILADVFNRQGEDHVIKMVKEWSRSAIRKYCENTALVSRMTESFPDTFPQVEIITQDNMEQLMKESSAFRKIVRGEAIGSLG